MGPANPEALHQTDSPEAFPGLVVDPATFEAARRALTTLEEQQKQLAERVAKEERKHHDSKAFLAAQRRELDDARRALTEECAASTAAAEAAATAQAKLQRTVLMVLAEKKRAEAAAAAQNEAAHPMIEALREVHEKEVQQLKEEHGKLVDEHNAVLASAEERIREQQELISSYAQQLAIQRDDLQRTEANAKTAAQQATKRQAELTRGHREREAELIQQRNELERTYREQLRETRAQFATTQEQLQEAQRAKNFAETTSDELLEARDALAATVSTERIKFSNLCRDRLTDGDDLLNTARKAAEVMLSLDMPHEAPADPDFARLRTFYAGMVEKLNELVPKLEAQLVKEGEAIAGAVARTILPRVHFLAPGFPFEALLDPFDEQEDHQAALEAVAPFIEEVKEATKPKP